VAARGRGCGRQPASGRHLLRSARLAAELVAAAGISRDELVVEIGAGTGRLTGPLADAAGRVIAVEVDRASAALLERRFAGRSAVSVRRADILTTSMPDVPYRAFGNVPFAVTTAILRRLLDDPRSCLTAADLIVQHGLARKPTTVRPNTMLSLGWLPWWRLAIERQLPPACFDPPPSVDAAVLAARRRAPALLDPADAEPYRRLLDRGFGSANLPLRRSLGLPPRRWKRFARERGLAATAGPRDLDVWEWIALFEVTREGRAGRPAARTGRR
jgi:23S rRNA (adenine-N6)-dimethyltransferase